MIYRKVTDSSNEQNRIKCGQAGVFRSVHSRHEQDSNVLVLVLPDKTKVWKQGKTLLHVYGDCHLVGDVE